MGPSATVGSGERRPEARLPLRQTRPVCQSCRDILRDTAVTNPYFEFSHEAAKHGLSLSGNRHAAQAILSVQNSAPPAHRVPAPFLARFLICEDCASVCVPYLDETPWRFALGVSMGTAGVDFVRVLSEENTCPQCAELYAWVDQRVCADCLTTVCPDCVATLGAAHALVCRVCYASRAAPPVTSLLGPRWRPRGLSSHQFGLRRWQAARAWTRTGAAALGRVGERCAEFWTTCVRSTRDAFHRGHLWGSSLVETSRGHVLRVRQGVRYQMRVSALALWLLFASARREAQRQ
jgi:hypothetical protein